MSELRKTAQKQLSEMAGKTIADLHLRAGGDPADRALIQRIASQVWDAAASGQVCVPLYDLPADNAQQALARSPLVATPNVASIPKDTCPFVVQFDRLYSLRHWRAEHTIATGLLALSRKSVDSTDATNLADATDLAGGTYTASHDEQQLAALICALNQQLLVLSGGPGTGKTTTLGTIVRALTSRNRKLRVALSAPTGKATARLNEAIGDERGVATASTLHRLLGYQTAGEFKFGPDNPLPYDVIVVDECSMVDAMLGERLFSALPSHAKLILSGDKDQLSSVEPGAFFGSVCAAGKSALSENVVILRKNYRQQDAPQIAAWAEAVRDGQLVDSVPASGEQVLRITTSGTDGIDSLIERAVNAYLPLVNRAATVTEEAEQLSLLKQFEQLRVLTAMRVGPFGVEAVNQRIINALQSKLELSDAAWFAGRLVIVSNNAPVLNLFNGDIGLTTTDASGQLSVIFN